MTSGNASPSSSEPRTEVYNLEFPSWIDEFKIGSYRFNRSPDYKNRLAKLQHLIAFQAEFAISRNAGENVATAHVEGPADEISLMFSGVAGKSALDDVLALLSLFTERDVFAERPNVDGVVVADPRRHVRGGILRCSIPFKAAGPKQYGDVGFAEALNNILALLKEVAWQEQYDNGYFIVLANQAFKWQPLESAFTQCWTIWEHLFAVRHRSWMTRRTIRSIESTEKIAFILSAYALKATIEEQEHSRLKELAGIRNRLVHYGRFPERERVHQDADMFCKITEFVIARILGLRPSNVFDTVEHFERFMKKEAQKSESVSGGPAGSHGQRRGPKSSQAKRLTGST